MLDQILERIQSKGWNVYEAPVPDKPETIIQRGPVDTLEINKMYYVFPMTEDPTNWQQVQEVSRSLKNQGIFPSIRVEPICLPLLMIIVQEDKITVQTGRSISYPYNDFHFLLEYLISTTQYMN